MATGSELRQMTDEELARMASELRHTVVNLRLKHRTGHLENTAELARTRRELARVLTLVREGELGLKHAVKTSVPAEKKGAEPAGGDVEVGTEPAKKPLKAKAEAAAPKGRKPKKGEE